MQRVVGHRPGIDLVLLQQRMPGVGGTVHVELGFQKRIHGEVEIEGIPGRPAYT